jgi:hypothetical protein
MKVLLLAFVMVLAASMADAFPRLTVTSSEVLQADPLQVKTTFDLDLVGPGSWCWIDAVEEGWWNPATGDTTKVLGGIPPSGWFCSEAADHRVIYVPRGDPLVCFGAGDHFTGFAIITNRVAPCLHLIFSTPLLGLDGSYHADVCLTDGPVPAQSLTWGALKATYR